MIIDNNNNDDDDIIIVINLLVGRKGVVCSWFVEVKGGFGFLSWITGVRGVYIMG